MASQEGENLDGDFKALNEVKRKRREEREAAKSKDEPTDHLEVVTETALETAAVQYKETEEPCTINYDALRTNLFAAVSSRSLGTFKNYQKEAEELELSLSDPALCEPEDKKTVLHFALLEGASEIANYLIEHAPQEFLLHEFDVVVRKITCKKTVLHILAEQGDLETIKKLLRRIPVGETRTNFLNATVMVEPVGQRPRPLDALQLAALFGHRELVFYLVVEVGMNVDQTNVKNDTAVLWASRANHIDTVRCLIELGADLNHQNDKGSTPLYWACRYGLVDMAKLLLEEGHADVHQRRSMGLVSPIVLSAALGYTDIVNLLLDHGADVNITITNGFTPLHHAAENGMVESIKTLLARGANVNQENISGEGALLIAAKAQEPQAVQVLAMNGADMDDHNKDGKSVWAFAIDAPNEDLLKGLISCYKKLQPSGEGKLVLPLGRNALHMACIKGDTPKMELLLQEGVDPCSRDNAGNTLIHMAARNDNVELLEKMMPLIDVNIANAEEETALFLAVRNGHSDSAAVLLKKSDLTKKNSSGETVLHVACKSPNATLAMVQQVVDMVVKAHNWSLVNNQDAQGNTALHQAARNGRDDLLPCLRNLSPQIFNYQGDTPAHTAVKGDQEEFMAAMLDTYGQDLNVNILSKSGASLLHAAARRGNADVVKLLILAGGDMALPNASGNTVLHMLVEEILRHRGISTTHLRVFQMVLDQALRWWCIKEDMPYPDEDSDIYRRSRKKAIIHLTSEISNKNNMSVLLLASKLGVKEALEFILRIEDVYLIYDNQCYVFDVTHLIPDTNQTQHAAKEPKSKNVVAPLLDEKEKVDAEKSMKHSASCLDLIVRVENAVVANQMLDIVPLKQLVAGIWGVYQIVYGMLMVIHVVYMLLLCTYAIPLISSVDFAQNVTDLGVTYDPDLSPKIFPYVLFLSWPLCLLVYELYNSVHTLYRWCTEVAKFRTSRSEKKVSTNQVLHVIVSQVSQNMAHIANIGFSTLVIVWYVLYLEQSVSQIYCIAMAVIIGWMTTISFTDGFEGLHSFSIMLKIIVVRDMVRFIILYLFVLMGFAYGFQAFLWLVPDMYPRDIWNYIFIVFNLMVGMGDFFDGVDIFKDSILQGIEISVKVAYILYIVLTTVILLNLLIAMMSDSYSDVVSREGTTWRVSSVRMALHVEKSMPFLPLVFKRVGLKNIPIHHDYDTGRWFLTLPENQVEMSNADDKNEVANTLGRLEREITTLNNSIGEIYESLGQLSEKVDSKFGRPSSARGWGRVLRRQSGLTGVKIPSTLAENKA